MSRGERFIALILAVTPVIPGLFRTTNTDSATIDVKIARYEIESLAHAGVDRIDYSDTFYLAIDRDASGMGTNVHEGDSFDVTRPDEMRFPRIRLPRTSTSSPLTARQCSQKPTLRPVRMMRAEQCMSC